MNRLIGAFLLGFAFGVGTLVVFRHEVQLTSDAGVLFILSLVGLALLGGLVLWFRSCRRSVVAERGPGAAKVEEEWVGFVWGSILLMLIYFALVVIVVQF